MGHKGSKNLQPNTSTKGNQDGVPISKTRKERTQKLLALQDAPTITSPESADFVIEEESEAEESKRYSERPPKLSTFSSTSTASTIQEESEEEEFNRTKQPLVSIDTPTPPHRKHLTSGILYLDSHEGHLHSTSVVDDVAHLVDTDESAIYARIKPKSKRPLSIPPNLEFNAAAMQRDAPALPDRRYSCDPVSLHNLTLLTNDANPLQAISLSVPIPVDGRFSTHGLDIEQLRNISLAANHKAPSPIEEDDFVDASILSALRSPAEEDRRISNISNATAYEKPSPTPGDPRRDTFYAEQRTPPLSPTRHPGRHPIRSPKRLYASSPSPLKRGKRTSSYLDALGMVLQESHV